MIKVAMKLQIKNKQRFLQEPVKQSPLVEEEVVRQFFYVEEKKKNVNHIIDLVNVEAVGKPKNEVSESFASKNDDSGSCPQPELPKLL